MYERISRKVLMFLFVAAAVSSVFAAKPASAGYLQAGNSYLVDAAGNTATATYYMYSGLYTFASGGDSSTEDYYAYYYANLAADSAYNAYVNCYYGYTTLNTTESYYAYIYAYYTYLYASDLANALLYIYSGYDYSATANVDLYWTNYYSSIAAYYAGVGSIGGTY